MHIETQFSIFMVNKPGVLANLLEELAKAKINILALTVMDSVEHGVLRVVGKSHEQVRKLLQKLNVTFNETDVLCVNLPNKAGAFADVAQKLARSHINVSYAYCTAGARGGRTTGILKVADVKKAMKILKSPAKKTTKKTIKRAPAKRK
ncbi:MAG: ACT domain-containing protein [Planctomycetes bacterium]|nr:ACT domain-containing protein [Planctomycetota bacterium]